MHEREVLGPRRQRLLPVRRGHLLQLARLTFVRSMRRWFLHGRCWPNCLRCLRRRIFFHIRRFHLCSLFRRDFRRSTISLHQLRGGLLCRIERLLRLRRLRSWHLSQHTGRKFSLALLDMCREHVLFSRVGELQHQMPRRLLLGRWGDIELHYVPCRDIVHNRGCRYLDDLPDLWRGLLLKRTGNNMLELPHRDLPEQPRCLNLRGLPGGDLSHDDRRFRFLKLRRLLSGLFSPHRWFLDLR